jgi:hypothetical protein
MLLGVMADYSDVSGAFRIQLIKLDIKKYISYVPEVCFLRAIAGLWAEPCYRNSEDVPYFSILLLLSLSMD